MDAIEYIKENTDGRTVLQHYNFRSIKETDYQIRACCGIHGGDNPEAFVWNKANDLWFCYTGDCGGGDIFDLVMKMEGVSFKEAVHKAAVILDLSIVGMKISLSENRLRNEHKQWLKQQMDRLNSNKPREVVVKDLVATDNFYRFEESTYEHFNATCISSVTLDEKTYIDKAMIPIYMEDTIICVGMRDTSGNEDIPKWLYHPRGVKLSNELYNLETVLQYIEAGVCEEIILVEGIFDVWSFFEAGIENVVAIFGSNISKEQYKTLMWLNVGLVFCFDNDSAGNKCTRKAKELFKGKTVFKTIELPEGKDPGDCTKEELQTAYMNRR